MLQIYNSTNLYVYTILIIQEIQYELIWSCYIMVNNYLLQYEYHIYYNYQYVLCNSSRVYLFIVIFPYYYRYGI